MWTPGTLPEVLCSNSVCFKNLTNAASLFLLLFLLDALICVRNFKIKFISIVSPFTELCFYACHVFGIHRVHVSHLNYFFVSHSESKLLPLCHHHAITIPLWSARHHVFESCRYEADMMLFTLRGDGNGSVVL